MRKGRPGQKTISLSSELHLVSRAIDGTRILAEQWRDAHLNTEDLPHLAHALHATLVLVRERLALVDSAVRDTLDPRHIFCRENEAFEEIPGDDGDAILRAWSAKKTAGKLRREAEQAERRLEVLADHRKGRKEDDQ